MFWSFSCEYLEEKKTKAGMIKKEVVRRRNDRVFE